MPNRFNYNYGITHGGVAFHSDDVFATAFCKYFAMKENVDFVFDRKFNVTDEELFSQNTIVYDIGYDFLPEYGIFDHHQADAPLREDGQKYSACGLILEHFGPTYFSEAELSRLKGQITKFIDYHDNGKLLPGECSSDEIYDLSVFSPFWDENPNLQTEHFNKAVNIALQIIDIEVSSANGVSNHFAKENVLEEINKRKELFLEGKERAVNIAIKSLETLDNGIITLNRFAPIKDLFADVKFLDYVDNPDIYFVIYPGDRNPFNIQVIPDKPESFGLKIPGGLSISLERDSEGAFIYPEGVNFVHANGFLAACETYEEALKLCERTLDKHFELSGERMSQLPHT